MKLLGNDVVTQEEFDTYIANEYNPTTKALSADIDKLKKITLASVMFGIIGTVLGLIAVFH